jgi:hypothetical protein
MQLTVEELMKINLLTSTYKDDDKKLTSELIKVISGSLEVEHIEVTKKISELNDFLLTEHDLIQRFVYDDVEYGFIPNISKITTGEFIDLDNYLSEEPKQLHKICAILYRPIKSSMGKHYEIEKYEGTDKLSKIMLNVDCKVALGALVFFWILSKSLLNLTNTYIQKEVMKVRNKI